MDSSPYMRLALDEAKKAISSDEVPVGCVLVHKNQVIAKAHNGTQGLCDATAHAEILTIRQACQVLQTHYLTDCQLYVTLEPCSMCAAAIAHARIPCVYFGAYDPKGGAIDHGAKVYRHTLFKPNVVGGILEKECGSLLTDFFQQKR